MKTLLNKTANMNDAIKHIGGALSGASRMGYEKVVRILLEKFTDASAPGPILFL